MMVFTSAQARIMQMIKNKKQQLNVLEKQLEETQKIAAIANCSVNFSATQNEINRIKQSLSELKLKAIKYQIPSELIE